MTVIASMSTPTSVRMAFAPARMISVTVLAVTFSVRGTVREIFLQSHDDFYQKLAQSLSFRLVQHGKNGVGACFFFLALADGVDSRFRYCHDEVPLVLFVPRARDKAALFQFGQKFTQRGGADAQFLQ